jgi:murein DD-endopeptidase MepM/ murein hydrolase activator NlpD
MRDFALIKLLFMCYAVIALCASCSVSKDPQRSNIRELQAGKRKEDTSYVYALPFAKGTSHLVVQGYYSRLSHKNRIAVDIKMKRGTKILAAREGIVIRLQEQNNKGGWNRRNREYANFVLIQHSDGTRAGYWHLQQNGVLMNLGDSVRTGQEIALSGHTGYSAFPHLHFMVSVTGNGRWQQVPTRFHTKKGPRYLRPLRCYRNK